LIGTWLLLPKIISRKRQDLESSLPIPLIHFLKVGVLRRIAAHARGIHDQEYLTFECLEIDEMAIDVREAKPIERCH
jgi:hypothetical protein